jgi:hypothetical protein
MTVVLRKVLGISPPSGVILFNTAVGEKEKGVRL